MMEDNNDDDNGEDDDNDDYDNNYHDYVDDSACDGAAPATWCILLIFCSFPALATNATLLYCKYLKHSVRWLHKESEQIWCRQFVKGKITSVSAQGPVSPTKGRVQ